MHMLTGNILLVIIIAMGCMPAHAVAAAVGTLDGVIDSPSQDAEHSHLPRGDLVDLNNLQQIRAGMSKDQVRRLLGSPNLDERQPDIDQWSYIFNRHADEGAGYLACLYQVRYGGKDEGHRVKSMRWGSPDCSVWAIRRSGIDGAVLRRFSLWVEVLFPSARHGSGDILPDGLEELSELVGALGASKVATIRVVGHADRMGSQEDNQTLSERRANTVRGLLIDNGLPAEGLLIEGAGEVDPVKQCEDVLPQADLVACLQSNRRVEVLVNGLE